MQLIDHVRKHGSNIRVHGNGFIQVDLDKDDRFHVWGHYAIPRQRVSSQIHNHRFGFESTVLVGALVQIEYEVYPAIDLPGILSAEYDAYGVEVREGEDTRLVLDDVPVSAEVRHGYPIRVGRGQSYTMCAGTYHETFVSEPTATVMSKRPPVRASEKAVDVRVLLRRGLRPDNDFNRYTLPEAELWDIVADVLQGIS